VAQTLTSVGKEPVDVVDLTDRVIGVASRREVRAQNLLHRGVSILCLDSIGHVYVHRRTISKDAFPGLYDMFVSGVVRSGESYNAAAGREIAEELGVSVAPQPLFKHLYRSAHKRCWIFVYEVVCEKPVTPDADEISWGTFMPMGMLLDRIDRWRFTPDNMSVFGRYLARQRLQASAARDDR
jgi:isopentenyldiphosphate isomerase